MTQLQMDYYIRAYELGNIARAADEFMVSRSVVSRVISTLEEELGHKLFERSKNGITPTPAGKEAYQSILVLRSDYSIMQERINKAEDDSRSPTIRVGISPSNGTFLYDLLYLPYKQAHPEVAVTGVETNSDRLCADLNDGKLDLIFLSGAKVLENYPNLEAKPLFTSQVVAVVSENGPLAGKQQLEMSDMEDRGFVTLRIANTVSERLFEMYRDHYGKEARRVLFSSSAVLLERVVRQSDVICIAPSQFISGWDGVTTCRLPIESAIVNYICWNKTVPHSDEIASLIKFAENLSMKKP